MLLQYFGASSFGGFGFLKIKKGTFEAEETTCQYGCMSLKIVLFYQIF